MHKVSLYGIKKYDLEAIEQAIASHLPDREYGRIVIKPNWVIHEADKRYPIEALVTHSTIIEAALRACLAKYPRVKKITVCDCPVQNCEWDKLCSQSGIPRLREKYEKIGVPVVTFRDFRQERYHTEDGFLCKDNSGDYGDPLGYSVVELGKRSYLEEVSTTKGGFRVSNYDPKVTATNHCRGLHRYCVSNTILECDLFINLPKMKTHHKAGITGALKNIVGINGNKAFLAHHRESSRDVNGDKFPPDVSVWFILHEKARKLFQKKSKRLFSAARWVWRHVKKAKGISSVDGKDGELSDKIVVNPGSWFGNDTIWRMVYDINRILRYADKNGKMQLTAQRDYLAVMDGIVAGEGPGPLQPWPVPAGLVLIGTDPFQVDMAEAQLMGFDIAKIPQLANYVRFTESDWAAQRPDEVMVNDLRNGQSKWERLTALPPVKQFSSPPGWLGHIEKERGAGVGNGFCGEKC